MTLDARPSSGVEHWTGGWLGHYHSSEDDDSCYERLWDMLDKVRDQAQHLAAIPVASQREIDGLRRRHQRGADVTAGSTSGPGNQSVREQVGEALGVSGAIALEELFITARTYNALKHAGINTVGEVRELRARFDAGDGLAFRRLKGIGRVAEQDILQALDRFEEDR
jgi:Bacterial RNA polymerase, alpha chain C terminal domain